jgi:type IV pilus assembly protein PilN
MIRINLLPIREAERQKSGRQFLLLMLILLLGEGGFFFIVHGDTEQDLKQVRERNSQLSRRLKNLKKRTQAVTKLKAQQKELERQKSVLNGLVDGQSGPVKMLNELSMILTPIDDPKARLRVQARGWNPDWDPKRIWIDHFKEEKRRVKIRGMARSNEDVAEFLKRLNTSRHFVNVEINVSSAMEIAELKKTTMYQFDFSGLVIYGAADIKLLAEGKLGHGKQKN